MTYLRFHFGVVQNIFLEKWGHLHGEVTRLMGGGGFGDMHFFKWCNLVRFKEYFLKFCKK